MMGLVSAEAIAEAAVDQAARAARGAGGGWFRQWPRRRRAGCSPRRVVDPGRQRRGRAAAPRGLPATSRLPPELLRAQSLPSQAFSQGHALRLYGAAGAAAPLARLLERPPRRRLARRARGRAVHNAVIAYEEKLQAAAKAKAAGARQHERHGDAPRPRGQRRPPRSRLRVEDDGDADDGGDDDGMPGMMRRYQRNGLQGVQAVVRGERARLAQDPPSGSKIALPLAAGGGVGGGVRERRASGAAALAAAAAFAPADAAGGGGAAAAPKPRRAWRRCRSRAAARRPGVTLRPSVARHGIQPRRAWRGGRASRAGVGLRSGGRSGRSSRLCWPTTSTRSRRGTVKGRRGWLYVGTGKGRCGGAPRMGAQGYLCLRVVRPFTSLPTDAKPSPSGASSPTAAPAPRRRARGGRWRVASSRSPRSTQSRCRTTPPSSG